MGDLDINSPRGQKTLGDEARCVSIIEAAYPGWSVAFTPKETSAAVDGVILQNGITRAIIEQKSRYDVSLDEFINRYRNQWLVTFDKIVKARGIAEAFCVPLVGLLYIVRDDKVLAQTLWRPQDGWTVSFTVKKTETQRSVNGGIALRDNAYIDMSKAKAFGGQQ